MFLPLLVDMGIDILNPVQWTCPQMDMGELKREFGGRICFHGAVENHGTGYILAPCHNIQAITPLENIIAMYDEARRYRPT